MNKLLVEFKDNNFDINIRKPKNFTWIKTNNPVNEKTFVSDNHIQNYTGGIAWLVESPVIHPQPYNWIKNNNRKYKYVLTYSDELVSIGENFLYYPFGNTLLDEKDFNLYFEEKNKLISMVISNKNYTYGHNFRHNCKNLLNGFVDLYGSGVNGIYSPKLESCKNYMFQVVVENCKYESLFTEKILDCFLSGVIPIYWGSNKVLELFDKEGIIVFNNEKELLDIVNNINSDYYYQKIDAVRNNFETAKKYSYSEDWIFENYPFLF